MLTLAKLLLIYYFIQVESFILQKKSHLLSKALKKLKPSTVWGSVSEESLMRLNHLLTLIDEFGDAWIAQYQKSAGVDLAEFPINDEESANSSKRFVFLSATGNSLLMIIRLLSVKILSFFLSS